MTAFDAHRHITLVGAVGALVLVLFAAAGVAQAAGAVWYVAPGGSDASSCASPTEPCATINGAIGKASAGDTIRVAVGTYTGSGDGPVVVIDKSATLEGGWDAAFSARPGVSTVDGQNARRGLQVAGAQARVERFMIQNGAATSFQGGGILVGGPAAALGARLELDRSTVRNSALGGIWSESPLLITNSTISGNSSNNTGAGGGITAAFGAPLTIVNSTITGNSHTSEGAGVLLKAQPSGSATAQLSNVTIVGNDAGFSGGGVRVEHGFTVHVRNTIVAGNTAGSWGEDFSVDVGAAVVSHGYNVGTGFTPVTGDVTTSDPRVGLLAGNGGPTATLALLSDSPAIDGGNPGGCRDENAVLITSDQRGVARPNGTACDVGALEAVPPANDDFADALSLDGLTPPLIGSNALATKETGEPDHGVNEGGASVWYGWTPAFTGTAYVSTADSDFDTLLGVYTGSAVASLTMQAANDDAHLPAGGSSKACFPASAGTRYSIAVDGFEAALGGDGEGSVTLAWGQYTSLDPCAVLPPTVSGAAVARATLSATEGTWAGSPSAFEYRWLACDEFGCFSISGATASTYTPPDEAEGYQLFVRVTAKHPSDPARDAINYSALTAPIAPAPGGGGGGGGGGGPGDLRIVGSVVPGTARVGDTLTWRLQVEDKPLTLMSGVHVDITLPASVVLTSSSTDRGPGCAPTGERRLRCNLDFLSGAAPVGNIVLLTTIAAAGDHVLTATAGFDGVDPTAADNTVTLTALTPVAAPPPVRVPTGVTRRGTAGADRLLGTPYADTLLGLAGNDRLFGLAGADRLVGGSGNDRLEGGVGSDRLLGGTGNDVLVGGTGADLLNAGDGSDRVLARDGVRDDVRCGRGRDHVVADRRDRVARDCETVRRR